MDRELNGVEMLQIREHLGGCDACSAELDELQRMKRLLAALPVAEPRVGLEAAIIAKARQERELISREDAVAVGRFVRALAIPRRLAIGIALVGLLLTSLLGPTGTKVTREADAMDISTCFAEHSTYQSYQPLAGGATVDMASTDARMRLADSER